MADVEANIHLVRAVARFRPDAVPSGYLLAAAILTMDARLDGRLLPTRGLRGAHAAPRRLCAGGGACGEGHCILWGLTRAMETAGGVCEIRGGINGVVALPPGPPRPPRAQAKERRKQATAEGYKLKKCVQHMRGRARRGNKGGLCASVRRLCRFPRRAMPSSTAGQAPSEFVDLVTPPRTTRAASAASSSVGRSARRLRDA